MKWYKRIFGTLLFFCLLFLTAYAAELYEYGEPTLSYEMESELSSSDYWYVYHGKDFLEKNQEQVYKGKNSQCFDMKSAVEAYDASASQYVLNYATKTIDNSFDISKDRLYAEFYVKGPDVTAIQQGWIRFVVYITKGDTITYWKDFIVDNPDENGWIRVWSVIPSETLQGYDSIHMSCLCEPTDEVEQLYLDSFSLRVIPCEINVQPLNGVSTDVVDLKQLLVYGIDSDGISKSIYTGGMDFYIKNGNAELTDKVLIFGETENEVTVGLSYFGMEKEFIVSRKNTSRILLSPLEINDGVALLEVTSTYERGLSGTFLWIINDGEEPYNIVIQEGVSISPNGTQTVASPKLHIPSVLNNPNVVLFYFDDANNYKKIPL